MLAGWARCGTRCADDALRGRERPEGKAHGDKCAPGLGAPREDRILLMQAQLLFKTCTSCCSS